MTVTRKCDFLVLILPAILIHHRLAQPVSMAVWLYILSAVLALKYHCNISGPKPSFYYSIILMILPCKKTLKK